MKDRISYRVHILLINSINETNEVLKILRISLSPLSMGYGNMSKFIDRVFLQLNSMNIIDLETLFSFSVIIKVRYKYVKYI